MMTREMQLQFLLFLKDAGLWYWNTPLISFLDSNFRSDFESYSFGDICTVVKLVGYNHQKSDEFYTKIEDCLKVHLEYGTQLPSDTLKDLIEGAHIGSISRKRLNQQISRALATHQLSDMKQVVSAVKLLSDYDIRGPHELLNTTVKENPKLFSLEDLSVLLMCKNVLQRDALAALYAQLLRKDLSKIDQESSERLALVFKNFKLNQTKTVEHCERIRSEANLIDIIQYNLREVDRGVVFKRSSVACDGRMKGSLIVELGGRKHFIEVMEDEFCSYTQEGAVQAESTKKQLRQRGRLAEQLAKAHGFDGYHCLSYVELEYMRDEVQVIDDTVMTILFGAPELQKQTRIVMKEDPNIIGY